MRHFVGLITVLIVFCILLSCSVKRLPLERLPSEITLPEGLYLKGDYLEMSAEELAELSDYALHDALIYRINHKVFSYPDYLEGVDSLNEKEQVYYYTSLYEAEVANGGICQYLANVSVREIEGVFSRLSEIKADNHRQLLENFINDNSIDISDKEVFKDILYNYEEKKDILPIEKFEREYGELPYLESYILDYVRENIDFFG